MLFRTAAGTKLVSAAINNRVLFEADDHNVAEGWSVIVKGTARMLRTQDEIEEAERAHVLPWTAMSKLHYVRVIPNPNHGPPFPIRVRAGSRLHARVTTQARLGARDTRRVQLVHNCCDPPRAAHV